MKQRKTTKRKILSLLLLFTAIIGNAATYPTLYVVGAFQGWDLPSAARYTANQDGVYTVGLNITDGNETFKMSFSGNSDWNKFDENSIGIGREDAWSRGIYDMVEQISNSRLPRGQWVITVYYDQRQIALSAPGEEVPEPGKKKYGSGTLPVLYITVRDENGNIDNEVIDYNLNHKNYFSGTYWLDLNDCEWLAAEGAKSIGDEDNQLPLQIKARGNYTRTGFSKKPFKIKLDKKQKMLGMTNSKHFALMAHADDSYGFMRNFVGFNLGKRIGLPWTPAQQPVELVINGDYRGLYFLTESIRIDSDRIDIVEGKDNETEREKISGGYVVELDNYDEPYESQITMTEKSCVPGHYLDALRITFDTPEVYSDLQRRFVSEQFEAMNNYVGTCNDNLWSYLDMDDAARYYLVKEIVSDTEAYHGSTYLFRDLGQGHKWHFSPLWDFGNAFNGYTSEFFYNNDPYGNTWIPSMRVNAKFNDKVNKTWLWFMSNCYDGIEDEITEYVEHIAAAAKTDLQRWTANDVPLKSVANYDMNERKQAVFNHLRDKISWLKGQFGDYTRGLYPEPERDTTEAAPLPDYAFTGVENVVVTEDEMTPNEEVYYNLSGQRVNHPMRGSIYITRKGVIIY